MRQVEITLDGQTYRMFDPVPATKILPGEIGWRNPRNNKLYIIGEVVLLKRVERSVNLKELLEEKLPSIKKFKVKWKSQPDEKKEKKELFPDV